MAATHSVNYQLATPADEADLRTLLLDNAMPGWVSIALTREPNYFAGSRLFGTEQTIIAREQMSRQPVGMCTYTRQPVHCNGQPAELGYLGGLRIAPAWRQRLRIVRQGFAAVRDLCDQPPAPLWYTAIAVDNHPARRLLEAHMPGLPRYTALNDMVTMLLPATRGKRHRLWQALDTNDRTSHTTLAALCNWYNAQACAYQFAPVLQAEWLRAWLQNSHTTFYTVTQNDRLLACMALWDQRACRQARALHYRWPLGLLRPAHNAWAHLTKRPALPRTGEALAHSFMAFLAYAPEMDDKILALVEDALALAATPLVTLGLHARHPQLPQLQARFKPWCYHTRLYTVSDAASHADTPLPLDGRVAQPEVAIL